MTDRKSLGLLVGTVVVMLAICEIAARIFVPAGLLKPAPLPNGTPQPVSAAEGMRYVENLPGEPGTERKWFLNDPPPLPRKPASAEMTARYDDFLKRGLYGPQAEFVWNRLFVQDNICKAPIGLFTGYPDSVQVFDPPSHDTHPRYRFPPNATLPSGLVTNQYGLRGPAVDAHKPPKTIRIAFAGSSTTVNPHNFAFSYPEYAVHWLNLWSQANKLDVRFEVLNAGREGILSTDIAAIVRDELTPLSPDLVIYYEGANQFAAGSMVQPEPPVLKPVSALEDAHKIPHWLRTYSALGGLVDRALLNRFTMLRERRKPSYRLVWPKGTSEDTADVDNPDLPSNLPVIVKDLDSIRAALRPVHGRLILASFVWLAQDGMMLAPIQHQHIYEQLHNLSWPLSYADVKRLADYQNRIFRAYAEKRGIQFLDIAGGTPRDPDLFIDAIHMTELGERIKGWVAFQGLVPFLRKEIGAGRLPQNHADTALKLPPQGSAEMKLACGPAR